MARTTFSVVAIRPGRTQDYAAFNRGVLVDAKGKALHSDLLSICVIVDANSKADAELQVRKQYPDHFIDAAATQRSG